MNNKDFSNEEEDILRGILEDNEPKICISTNPSSPNDKISVIKKDLESFSEDARKKISEFVEECKKLKIIRAKFEETELYCGDKGYVTAWNQQNITPGSPVSIKIIRKRDNVKIDTKACNLALEKCTVAWAPKKEAGYQAGDRHLIDPVTADGATGKGDNEFKFKELPDKEELSFSNSRARAGGGTINGVYDIKFDHLKKELRITVRIQFRYFDGTHSHNCQYGLPSTYNCADPDPLMPGQSITVSSRGGSPAAVPFTGPRGVTAQNMLDSAAAIFNGKNYSLKRAACIHGGACTCEYKIRFNFQESAVAHHSVNLFRDSWRANSRNWSFEESIGARPVPVIWAHEIGHLLGWPDEYAGGAIAADLNNQYTQEPQWLAVSPDLMGAIGPAPGMRSAYAWDFRDWLNKQFTSAVLEEERIRLTKQKTYAPSDELAAIESRLMDVEERLRKRDHVELYFEVQNT